MMVKWLVVGIGDIATRRVLPAIKSEPRSDLVGIVTRNPAKAASYGVPAWGDLDQALSDSGAGAVYICTPVFLHARQTMAALLAGRDVLCEKPMATCYPDALRMQRTAESTGRIFGIAYYRRMYPKVCRAKDLVDAGVIGRPFLAEATSHGWSCPVEGDRSWLGDPILAGAGPLFDVACHRIDLMNYFFGTPGRTSGHLSTLVQPLQVEDNATVLIEYDSGLRGVVDVRWHSRINRDEFRIRGTDGEIDLSPLNGPFLISPRGTEEMPAPDNLHYPCIEDFVTAVIERRSPRASGVSALDAELVINRALGRDC